MLYQNNIGLAYCIPSPGLLRASCNTREKTQLLKNTETSNVSSFIERKTYVQRMTKTLFTEATCSHSIYNQGQYIPLNRWEKQFT